MIAEGKGDIEWERKIPDEKLGELKDMLATSEFKKNLPKVQNRINNLNDFHLMTLMIECHGAISGDQEDLRARLGAVLRPAQGTPQGTH